MHQAVIVHEH